MTRRDRLLADHSEAVRAFTAIPTVGRAAAEDLVRLGVTSLDDLARRKAEELYATLCALDGARHAPGVRETFAAAIRHAQGLKPSAPARPAPAKAPAPKPRPEARPPARPAAPARPPAPRVPAPRTPPVRASPVEVPYLRPDAAERARRAREARGDYGPPPGFKRR